MICVQEFSLPLASVAVQTRVMTCLILVMVQSRPGVSSKLYVAEVPLTPMVKASALPLKFCQAPRPLPAARCTPPPPTLLTMRALGNTARYAESGFTPAPGDATPELLREYQPPLSASHFFQEPSTMPP